MVRGGGELSPTASPPCLPRTDLHQHRSGKAGKRTPATCGNPRKHGSSRVPCLPPQHTKSPFLATDRGREHPRCRSARLPLPPRSARPDDPSSAPAGKTERLPGRSRRRDSLAPRKTRRLPLRPCHSPAGPSHDAGPLALARRDDARPPHLPDLPDRPRLRHPYLTRNLLALSQPLILSPPSVTPLQKPQNGRDGRRWKQRCTKPVNPALAKPPRAGQRAEPHAQRKSDQRHSPHPTIPHHNPVSSPHPGAHDNSHTRSGRSLAKDRGRPGTPATHQGTGDTQHGLSRPNRAARGSLNRRRKRLARRPPLTRARLTARRTSLRSASAPDRQSPTHVVSGPPATGNTCTSPPRPASGCTTPRAPSPTRSTPAPGADKSSPPEATRLTAIHGPLRRSGCKDLPEWLQTALTAPQQPVAAPFPLPAVRDASRCAQVALERESAAVAARRNIGQRNSELLRAVIRVGRYVARGDIDHQDVEAAFQGAGESAGLTAAECRATIRSALAYSQRTPSSPSVATVPPRPAKRSARFRGESISLWRPLVDSGVAMTGLDRNAISSSTSCRDGRGANSFRKA